MVRLRGSNNESTGLYGFVEISVALSRKALVPRPRPAAIEITTDNNNNKISSSVSLRFEMKYNIFP